MTTNESLEQVRGIVEDTLNERFKDEFVFDPIVVIPAIDEYGDDYLKIVIVFAGDQKHLDPRWTSRLIGRLRPKMDEVGVTAFPMPEFVEKSEWRSVYKSGRKLGLP